MQLSFKHIAPRVLVMMLTVWVSAVVYKKVFWIPELKDQGPMLFNLIEFQNHNDVLYFGESSNYWVAPEDTDKRTISDMINDSLQGFRLSGIQVPAYHAGMFLPVIRHIDPKSRVKTIVVTMNLRSFDKPWIYSTQEGALMRTRCFYYSTPPLFNRMCATLGYYDNPSAEQQDANMLYAFEHDSIKVDFPLSYHTVNSWKDHIVYKKPDGSIDEEKQALAHHYVKAYAFSIDTANNPRVKDFDAIVRVCHQKKIKVCFNIMAENTEWADSLVGTELSDVMRYNRDLLVSRYTAMGAIVVDNLDLVPGKHFGEKNWTTEHYDQYGRLFVARQVRNALRSNIRRK